MFLMRCRPYVVVSCLLILGATGCTSEIETVKKSDYTITAPAVMVVDHMGSSPEKPGPFALQLAQHLSSCGIKVYAGFFHQTDTAEERKRSKDLNRDIAQRNNIHDIIRLGQRYTQSQSPLITGPDPVNGHAIRESFAVTLGKVTGEQVWAATDDILPENVPQGQSIYTIIADDAFRQMQKDGVVTHCAAGTP
jgi:hypothetical protein